MIGDSIPWKDDLLRVADDLAKRKEQVRWTERTYYLVERDMMTAAYAVRKLIDSHKVSDELRSERIRVIRHALIGEPVDIWTRYEFWEHYDLEHGTQVTLSLSELCNQIIHSWIFVLSSEKGSPGFNGIFVSSDYERKSSVYFVPVNTLIHAFRAVGNDEILVVEMRADQDGVRHITKSSRELT